MEKRNKQSVGCSAGEEVCWVRGARNEIKGLGIQNSTADPLESCGKVYFCVNTISPPVSTSPLFQEDLCLIPFLPFFFLIPTVIRDENVQQQENAYDCGDFAIANAVSVAIRLVPVHQRLCTNLMRSYIIKIFQNKNIQPFLTLNSFSAVVKRGRPQKQKLGRQKLLLSTKEEQKSEARKRY